MKKKTVSALLCGIVFIAVVSGCTAGSGRDTYKAEPTEAEIAEEEPEEEPAVIEAEPTEVPAEVTPEPGKALNKYCICIKKRWMADMMLYRWTISA